MAYSGHCSVYLGKCSNSEMCFLLVQTSMDENCLIESYFWDGFKYHAILRFLNEYHGINMSYSTLRRRLRDLGLARRQQSPPLLQVWRVIHQELQGPGECDYQYKILVIC